MYELCIKPCHEQDAEKLSDELEESFEAVSVSMMDFADSPILEPGVGETPLWGKLILLALFKESNQAHQAEAFVRKNYPYTEQIIQHLPEQNWERMCLERFKPMQFGKRLWVCPSWHTPPEVNAVNLILDPGLAFGTGTHETTALCLTWLDSQDLRHQTILDYGCGSGILALAALKLGAKHAYAVDIDHQALLAANQNREMNTIPAEKLTLEYPEKLQCKVDIIIANILLTPLLNLVDTFHHLLAPQGKLIVSGIFSTQAMTLIDAYENKFQHQSTQSIHEWSMLEFMAK